MRGCFVQLQLFLLYSRVGLKKILY